MEKSVPSTPGIHLLLLKQGKTDTKHNSRQNVICPVTVEKSFNSIGHGIYQRGLDQVMLKSERISTFK